MGLPKDQAPHPPSVPPPRPPSLPRRPSLAVPSSSRPPKRTPTLTVFAAMAHEDGVRPTAPPSAGRGPRPLTAQSPAAHRRWWRTPNAPSSAGGGSQEQATLNKKPQTCAHPPPARARLCFCDPRYGHMAHGACARMPARARASLSARACASVHVCANGCVSVCSRPTRKTFRRCPWALPHRSHPSPIPLRIARKSGPYDLPSWSVRNAENVITRRLTYEIKQHLSLSKKSPCPRISKLEQRRPSLTRSRSEDMTPEHQH